MVSQVCRSHYFFILSGAVGIMVGYIEFYLFKLYNDEIEE